MMIMVSHVYAQVQSYICMEGLDDRLFLYSFCNISQFGVSANGFA